MKRHPKMRQKTESVNEDTENYHYSITVSYIFKKTEERLNSLLKRNTKNIKICKPKFQHEKSKSEMKLNWIKVKLNQTLQGEKKKKNKNKLKAVQNETQRINKK